MIYPFFQLQESFENLQRQAIDAFKRLASNKKIISHLEAKIAQNEEHMEALKKTMSNIIKGQEEDPRSVWNFGYGTCHIWQKRVKDS